jgi:hypothetical protein
VDTLHASLGGGSESNAQDIGILLDGVKSLQSAVGGAAILVHHTGWDTSRERGSSAIGAAVDVKIQVQPLAGGNLEIRVRKLRDGIEPPPFVLRLRATNGTAVPERVAEYLSSLTAHHRALLSALADAAVHTRSQCIAMSGLPKTSCDRARDDLVAMSAIARNPNGLRITERGLELLRSEESQIPTSPKRSHGTSPAAVPHVPHPLGWDLGLRGGTGNGKGANATDAAARTCSDIRELEIERVGMQADA